MRRWWTLALWLAGILMLTGVAGAVELPPGTKNFSAPSSTPNYFSNEVGAAQGHSAGSVPIGHISGPSVGHAVVMSGPRGKPGKVVRVKGKGRHRVAASRAHAKRLASRRRTAPPHAHVQSAKTTKTAVPPPSDDSTRRR